MTESSYSGHSSSSSTQLLFAGAGNMGGAILEQVLKSDVIETDKVGLYHPDPRQQTEQAQHYGVSARSPESLGPNGWILVAVKPWKVSELAEQLEGAVPTGVGILSVVAGAKLDQLGQAFRTERTVRSLPSLAARYALSPTAVQISSTMNDDDRAFVRKFFEIFGSVHEIEEAQFPAFSCLASAGPAFISKYLLELQEASIRSGVNREAAEIIMRQLVQALPMLLADTALDHIMAKIATPGGITQAGLDGLEGLRPVIEDALAGAIDRALSLEKA